MQAKKNVNERWIMNQLMGIRTMERELATAMGKPSNAGKEQLRRRIQQLNAWVDAVDRSLSATR